MENKLNLLPKILLGILGLLLAFIISLVIDWVLDIYLHKTGYFKAISPSVSEIYNASEFKLKVKISSQGLRNKEVTIPKPKDTFRILSLGDSFTFGWGVEENQSWPGLLEKMLVDKGKNIEVINGGVPGVGLYDELKICQAYLHFEPDMVIIGFYSSKDFAQAATLEYEISQFGKLINTFRPTLTRISSPIISNWHSEAKIGEKVDIGRIWSKVASEIIKQNPILFSKIDPKMRRDLIEGRLNPALFEFSRADPDFWVKILDEDNFQSALKATANLLRQIKTKCADKIPAILLFLPSGELVSESFFPFRQAFGFNTDEALNVFDVDTLFSKVVKRVGFSYISLLGEFRKIECLDCFFPYDSHFNAKGHQKTAEYLFEQILDKIP